MNDPYIERVLEVSNKVIENAKAIVEGGDNFNLDELIESTSKDMKVIEYRMINNANSSTWKDFVKDIKRELKTEIAKVKKSTPKE